MLNQKIHLKIAGSDKNSNSSLTTNCNLFWVRFIVARHGGTTILIRSTWESETGGLWVWGPSGTEHDTMSKVKQTKVFKIIAKQYQIWEGAAIWFYWDKCIKPEKKIKEP